MFGYDSELSPPRTFCTRLKRSFQRVQPVHKRSYVHEKATVRQGINCWPRLFTQNPTSIRTQLGFGSPVPAWGPIIESMLLTGRRPLRPITSSQSPRRGFYSLCLTFKLSVVRISTHKRVGKVRQLPRSDEAGPRACGQPLSWLVSWQFSRRVRPG